ncbi:hypothetical protein V8E53_008316 [Lactarius tabidus]
MSSKSRHSSSASTPNTSKLPKFLQSKQTRDRSRSMIDPASGGGSIASSSSHGSSVNLEAQAFRPRKHPDARGVNCRSRRLLLHHMMPTSEDFRIANDSTYEPPTIESL